jgi:hypothetical protein
MTALQTFIDNGDCPGRISLLYLHVAGRTVVRAGGHPIGRCPWWASLEICTTPSQDAVKLTDA